MAKRKPFTMESNLKKIEKEVEELPHGVMATIGKNLVKEIRPKTRRMPGKKAFLAGTTSYWARKIEKDLQIGYMNPERIGYLKNTKAVQEGDMKWQYDQVAHDPIKEVVVANLDTITRLIGEALNQISKK